MLTTSFRLGFDLVAAIWPAKAKLIFMLMALARRTHFVKGKARSIGGCQTPPPPPLHQLHQPPSKIKKVSLRPRAWQAHVSCSPHCCSLTSRTTRIRTAVAAALCLHRRSLNLASYTPFDSFLLSPLEIPRLLEFTANMGMTHPGEHASLPNQTSHLEQRVNESQTACGGNRYAVCCDCGMINIRRIRFWQPEPHGTL